MTDGLILLGFLGILVAFFTVRMRRRIGLGSNTKTWVTVITGCVVLGLVLWAASHP
jgi:NO-binding membrane sensor protein with MHYT domain